VVYFFAIFAKYNFIFMKTKLISASLMLGALLACKKKDNKPNLEPLLVGTTWEIEKYDGVKTVTSTYTSTKSWAGTQSGTDPLEIAYADFDGHGIAAMPFTWEFWQPGTETDEYGHESSGSYTSEGIFVTTTSKEECKTGQAALNDDWFEQGEDYKMIALIQKDYLNKEICHKESGNYQYYFSVSGSKLNSTGMSAKGETTYYEKSTNKEIGKATYSSTGSWNFSYVKK
jgi:hypothetical protein